MAAPAGVALARLRSRPGRNVLLLLGIAAAAGMLVAVLGATVIARDLSLQRLVRELPEDQRSFRVDLAGFPAFSRELRPDDVARRAGPSTNAKLSVVAFRDVWLDGEFIRLSGIDGHRDRIHLVSGRFPSRCDAEVCEVLQVGSGGRHELDETGIHLLRVGMGELREPERFGTVFTNLRQQRAQGSYPKSTLLLAPSADMLERLPSVELLMRLASWVVPLEGPDVHEWQIEDVLRRESRAQAILDANPTFTLAGPDFALIDAKTRGDTYGERMALIGGSVAVALFGFALCRLASPRHRGRAPAPCPARRDPRADIRGEPDRDRRDRRAGLAARHRRRRGRSRSGRFCQGTAGWRDASPWPAHERGCSRPGLWLRFRCRRPAGRRQRRGTRGSPLPHPSAGRRRARSGARGRRGDQPRRPRPARIVRRHDVPAPLAGVDLHRGWSRSGSHPRAGLGLGERLARRGSIALRLALLALARSPARTATAGAFLVVTIALIVFAATYSATLERGARDEGRLRSRST